MEEQPWDVFWKPIASNQVFTGSCPFQKTKHQVENTLIPFQGLTALSSPYYCTPMVGIFVDLGGQDSGSASDQMLRSRLHHGSDASYDVSFHALPYAKL